MSSDDTRLRGLALGDRQIAKFWDWDISDVWVREKLASRIRDAGYVVVPAALLARAEQAETVEDEREALAALIFNENAAAMGSGVTYEKASPRMRRAADSLATAIRRLPDRRREQ